ncbi:MAG: DUF1778 domain-containing protein [Tagaea sp.]|nr:DUF1778 domain-containing protein [Tagaea sp.]
MKAPLSARRRDTVVNLRAPQAWRALVDRAAALQDKTRTDFILEAVRRQAEDVLLDQRFFELDAKRYKAFLGLLNAPPAPDARLVDLMRAKAPWPAR